MKKKIIGMIIMTTLVSSLVACGGTDEDKNAKRSLTIETTREVGENEKTKDLKGEWASKDFTYNSFKEESNKLSDKIKELSGNLGLQCKDEEKVVEVDGIIANIKSIYADNEEPEDNKLESMQFATEFLGKSQEGGKLKLKMSLKFNGEKAVKDGDFNFGDTSLAKYVAILTGDEERDYSKINEKIMEVIKSDKPEGVVEDEVKGLHEEISISKEYIVYTLQTKEFKFTQNEDAGI